MPPKLMAPERRHGRARGKSDPIDALAVARAALREPDLSRPQPSEREPSRDLKLLVDHRDDLVDERRRMQQRLRWHLYQLDPTYVVPLRMLDRARSHLERVSRWLARQRAGAAGAARTRARQPLPLADPDIDELDQRARATDAALAPALLELPGCGAITAAKLLAEIGPIDRFKSDAQLARHSGVAPLEASSGRIQRHRLDRGGNRQLNAALHRIAITQTRIPPASPRLPRTQKSRRQEPPRSHSAASNDSSSASSINTLKNEPRLDIGATLAQSRQSGVATARRGI